MCGRKNKGFMGKITFILGGVRSGKSRYGVGLAKKGKQIAFLATAQALDKEMKQRISKHKKERPKNWVTFEEPRNIAAAVKKISGKFDVILIDCLTLWVSNCLLGGMSIKLIEKEIEELLFAGKKSSAQVILVSNEVGLGVVPDNKLARDFRDLAGRVNQITAQYADTVVFMVAGIPMVVK